MKTTKFILVALLLSIGWSWSPVKAQAPDANVTLTKIVEVSADDVWEVLRKMDDIDKFSSLIGKVEWKGDHGIGGQRVCLPPEGGQGSFTEHIVAFDDSQRSYSYAVVEGVPAQGMVNTFKVVDLGYQKSMIVWSSSYEAFMENPNMTEEQFLGFLNQSVQEMVENVAQAAKKV